jgi:lysophospholipase L1-like esterase
MAPGRCCIPEPLPPDLQVKLDRCLPLKHRAPILLIGDSMLARFQDYGTGKGLLDPELFENAAVGGSTTSHWVRLLQTTDFAGISGYKKIVLMLGTNNIPRNEASTTDIADGLTQILTHLKPKAVNTEILFVPIQPRWDLNRPGLLRDIELINEAVGKHCRSLSFFARDKSLYAEDLLHLNRRGYEALAKVITALLEEL